MSGARQVGTVEALYRYPVKSMLGESVDEIEVTELGFAGDRLWALRNERRGDFMTAKRVPALMNFRAHSGDPVPEIELPDGSRLRADDSTVSARMSEFLDHPVSIWPIAATPPDPTSLENVEDPEADFRHMMAREGGEPTPDFSGMPDDMMAFLARPDRPHVDLSPLMLMSRQSIESIDRAVPDAAVDVRRFRPSLLVDANGESAFPEQDWIGHRVALGEVILSLPMTCPRCAMTTHAVEELPKAPLVMRKLVTEAAGNLGVYATIEKAGTLRVGDPVELLGPA